MKKTVFSAILILSVLLSVFTGCSKITDEPLTTAIEKHTYVNAVGQKITAVENEEKLNGKKLPDMYTETIEDVEFVLRNYYVFEKNVASLSIEDIEYTGLTVMPQANAAVKMLSIGRRADDMKIGYTAYDANGKVLRRSYILVLLKGVKKNETVTDEPFEFPIGTARVVFHNYDEI